uniref:SURF1-like protein n=1 Tax=Macrostomum lignano TaxID=282301 RepID=A0A1I8GXQ6_9PLAT
MYRRNFPNDPGFADSIAVAARQQQMQQSLGSNRTRGVRLVRYLVFAALLLAGCCLAYWNEARAVARDRILYEGLERVTSLPAAEYHSTGNEGRLVHVSGQLTVSGWCLDPEFRVRLRAYRMQRTVEMYQWREELEHSEVAQPDGSSRTESVPVYRTDWLPYLVDSRQFQEQRQHQNPRSLPHASINFTADAASLGAFELAPVFLDQLTADTALKNPPSSEVPLEELSKRGYQWLDGHLYAAGSDPRRPQVGDARIRWSYGGLAGEAVTIVGRQSGSSLAAFPVPNGEIDSIALLARGYQSPRRMFAWQLAKSRLHLWLLRAAAWLLMLIACFVPGSRANSSVAAGPAAAPAAGSAACHSLCVPVRLPVTGSHRCGLAASPARHGPDADAGVRGAACAGPPAAGRHCRRCQAAEQNDRGADLMPSVLEGFN